MIHTLPNEVLRIITDELSFDDKLNLCKTCYILHEQISLTNLYETLVIKTNTEDIIEMFQDKILDGTHVKTLDIDIDDVSDKLYANLADIFPNITRVKTIGNKTHFDLIYELYQSKREDRVNMPLLKWKDSLKKYDSHTDLGYFRNELFCSTFPHLEELNFSYVGWIPGRSEGYDPLYLSKGIKNAPMLTKLTLTRCDISIRSLEEIHNGCPYLCMLELLEMTTVIDENTLPPLIIPAKPVLHFDVDGISMDDHGLFLDYVILKYPSLHYLGIHFDHEERFNTVYNLGHYYKSFMDKLFDMTDDEYDIYSYEANRMERSLKAYKNSFPTFLFRIPKSIKTLIIPIDILDREIETIYEANLALSALEFTDVNGFGECIKVHQLEYIKNLSTLKSFSVYIHSSAQTCQTDFISDTITSLDLTLRDTGLTINWILSMFPSLESLIVDYQSFQIITEKIDNTACDVKTYPKLQKIELKRGTVDPEFINYIKTAAPNLEELKCDINIPGNKGDQINYTIDFTSLNLTKLDLVISPMYVLNFYTVISTPRETQLYFQKQIGESFSPLLDESDLVNGSGKVLVICGFNENFSLNNYKFSKIYP